MSKRAKPGLWGRLTTTEKAEEFDASCEDPHGYVAETFLQGKQTSWGKTRERQIQGKESE